MDERQRLSASDLLVLRWNSTCQLKKHVLLKGVSHMKIRAFAVCVVVMLLRMWMCGPCHAGNLYVDGASDYELTAMTLRWGPDERASIGLLAMTDSDIFGRHVMVGPVAQFATGEIYQAALNTILPTGWSTWTQDLPLKPFARIGLAWDIGSLDGTGEDGANSNVGNIMFVAGTGTEICPDWAIHPFVFTGYYLPEGNAPESEQIRAQFGVVWKLF
jgi:hypothetical protein